jgi:hypothetical protein
MNECNQPRFLNPQWDRAGQNQSAAICGRALAAAYDALKAVDRSNFVWGVGLSPRGNDRPAASTNASTSPVKFLGYLGAWFKAYAQKTYRRAPLMDGLDFHPYPVPQSLPFAAGYANPKDASVTNLPRIYQAFYDAFKGTPQKTIGQQVGGGLPVSLNEVGIQTTPAAAVAGRYTGAENGEGVSSTGGEDYQAAWYEKLVDFALCDADITKVNIFKLVDETALEGWQSGLFYQGYVAKLSAAAFKAELAKTAGRCPAGQAAYFAPSAAPATKLVPEKNTVAKKPAVKKTVAKKGVAKKAVAKKTTAKAAKTATKKVVKKRQHRQ